MIAKTKARWSRRLGLAAIAALLGLGSTALHSTPAEAHRPVIIAGPVVIAPMPHYGPPRHYRAGPRKAHRKGFYGRAPRAHYRACGPGWRYVPAHYTRGGRWFPPTCHPRW
jgi:hypothetical protein